MNIVLSLNDLSNNLSRSKEYIQFSSMRYNDTLRDKLKDMVIRAY